MSNFVERNEQIAWRRVLKEAPMMQVPVSESKDLLSRVVSWDRVENKLVNLGEYVARNLTTQAFDLQIVPEVRTDCYPQPYHLGPDELSQVSVAFLKDAEPGTFDRDGYSTGQLIEEVRKFSRKGLEEMGNIREEQQFLVDLVALGKVRINRTT